MFNTKGERIAHVKEQWVDGTDVMTVYTRVKPPLVEIPDAATQLLWHAARPDAVKIERGKSQFGDAPTPGIDYAKLHAERLASRNKT